MSQYNQHHIATIETTFSSGEEVHLLTQDTKEGERMLNIRVCRVAPSNTGHVGYTKKGFYLTKNEAELLHEALGDLIDDPKAWEAPTSEMKEVGESLKTGDE